jgi:prepilin-type N-terminal cleavage/methylation domain-containing protein
MNKYIKKIKSIIYKKKSKNRFDTAAGDNQKELNSGGFTLVEVSAAMVIMLIALLGVFITFTYAVNYNAGNNSRSEALAILQQEVEKMRSAKFTPSFTDSSLVGGTKASKNVIADSGNSFRIDIAVDDDPNTDLIQIDNTTTLKEVYLTVRLNRPTPGWQTAVPATVVLQRVRSN